MHRQTPTHHNSCYQPTSAYHTRWFDRYAHSCTQTNQLKKHARTASYLQNNAKHTYTSCKKVVQMHTSDMGNFFRSKECWFLCIYFHILSIKRCLSHTSRLLANLNFYNNGLQNLSQNKENHIWIAPCPYFFRFEIIKVRTKRINGSQIAVPQTKCNLPTQSQQFTCGGAVSFQGCKFLGVVSLTNYVVSKKSVNWAQKEY